MNSNAYVKSMQDLGKIFNDEFEESWIKAQVDGFKIRIANMPEDDKFYTCGTVMVDPDKSGYTYKYRDGRTYTNRNLRGNEVLNAQNEALGIISNFISGYARVNTANEGNKILVLGNYVLPEKCTKKVSEIYYDCKAFLTLSETDFPFDPNHPSRDKEFYINAYRNVLIHGLTEKYCSLRDDFDKAKTIEERAVIYAKAKAAADEYLKYEPLFVKKEKALGIVERDKANTLADNQHLAAIFAKIFDNTRIDENDLNKLRQQVENLVKEKTYITQEKYTSLQASGQDMSKYEILPSQSESVKLYNNFFDKARTIQEANLMQDAITAFSAIISGKIICNTKLFKDILEKEGIKEFQFDNGYTYNCFTKDLYTFLLKLGYNVDKAEQRENILKKIYPLACYSAHSLHEEHGDEIIRDFAADAIMQYHLENNDASEEDNQENEI